MMQKPCYSLMSQDLREGKVLLYLPYLQPILLLNILPTTPRMPNNINIQMDLNHHSINHLVRELLTLVEEEGECNNNSMVKLATL